MLTNYVLKTDAEFIGWNIEDNFILMTKDITAGQWGSGLVVFPGVTARNNTIYQGYANNNSYPIVAYGIHDEMTGENQKDSLRGAILIGNHVIGDGINNNHLLIGSQGDNKINLFNIFTFQNIY